MPALSSLKRPDPVRCEISFGDEQVRFVFDRNRMTQRWVKGIQQGLADEDVETAAKSLAELLLEWDIVEEDGTPTPITVGVLADLPLAFIHAVDEAIGESVPGAAEGNASPPSAQGLSSGSTKDSRSFLNGSETSTSPKPLASPS